MRGNELECYGDARSLTATVEFPIPMRGNEIQARNSYC